MASVTTCGIDGCEAASRARGWCTSHYNRWYTTGSPEKAESPPACPTCGAELARRGRAGPPPSYCSQKCKSAASYKRRKAAGTIKPAPRKSPTVVPCESCASPISTARDARFCSDTCSQRAREVSAERACTIEGCARAYRAKGLCNMHYKATLRADGRVKSPPWDDRRRANYQKRRAFKKGVDAERVVNAEVFERDGWVCGICSEPVDSSLSWPDPRSASLDHVVPLSKGGAHAYANVQLAHLGCNVGKGARIA